MLHKHKGITAFLITILCSSLIQTMPLDEKSLFIPKGLGDIIVTNDHTGFKIASPTGLQEVCRHNMSPELRGISNKDLAQLVTKGAYLSVNKKSNEEYTINLDGRVNGGGPVIGKTAFWITKIVGYIGLGIVVAIHPQSAAELPHLREAVDAAAIAAEAVGSIVPGP